MNVTLFMLLRGRQTMGGNQGGGPRRPVYLLSRRAQGWSTKPPNPVRMIRMEQAYSLPYHRWRSPLPKRYVRSGRLGMRLGPLTTWLEIHAEDQGAGMMITSPMMMASMRYLTDITRAGNF